MVNLSCNRIPQFVICTVLLLFAPSRSAFGQPRFTDVTSESGLSIAENTGVGGTNPHGVAVEDFDGDSLFDLVILTFGAPHVRYFRNLGGLKFTDVTAQSGLEAFSGDGTGAAIADYDCDGKLDLFLSSLGNGASRLFRGRAGGTFEDVSADAKVLLDTPARSCAWSDIDADGWLDLYVTCPQGPNRLFHNQGNGTFVDIATEAGVDLAERHSLGCAFGDFDADGRDDLFVANYESRPSALFRNLGGGRFEDVTAQAGLDRKASAVGCVFADVSGRGRLDLYVTTDSWLSGVNATEAELRGQGHTVEPNLLLRNEHPDRFLTVSGLPSLHKTLSHDVIVEDLNHDGRREIYVGVDSIPTGNVFATSKGGNPLWSQTEGGEWREVAREWGVAFEGNCVCVPAADFDNDGDLDLLLVNFYSNVVLYRNNTDDQRWLRVRIVPDKRTRSSIGCRVKVYPQEIGSTRLLGFAQVQSGAGYGRCSPLEAHFGLGDFASSKLGIEVEFPSNERLTVENVKPGELVTVRTTVPVDD